MKSILWLAFTAVAVNFVMGDGDSDYDYDYEPLDCTADDVYTCSSEYGDDCIPGSYVCDNEIDCEDGSDEADCGDDWEATPFDEWYYADLDCTAEDVYTCSSELGDACIPEDYVCDHWLDCEDGSDEADCGEGWFSYPLDELYDDGEVLRSDARRKATSKAAKQARVKARAEAVAEPTVE